MRTRWSFATLGRRLEGFDNDTRHTSQFYNILQAHDESKLIKENSTINYKYASHLFSRVTRRGKIAKLVFQTVRPAKAI